MVSTTLLTIKLQLLKLLNRWYLPPERIHHFDKLSSPYCWKRCGQKVSYIHCWWECKIIKEFWNDVVEQINAMLALKIPSKAECLLLNYWETYNIPSCNKHSGHPPGS